MNRRVIIVVLDGAGVGALPDAEAYGDEGANTLLNVIRQHGPLKLDNLYGLGLGHILLNSPGGENFPLPAREVNGYYGSMAARSPGKDTTSGHWELSGLILSQPFPLYPKGFPAEVISLIQEAVGRKVLGNYAASGTQIIQELGDLHLKTGSPIVYTSADSVFQIAAHEEVAPLEELYRWCNLARELLQGEHAVGRVIARPFSGSPGAFKRTKGRRDFSLHPPGPTLLDRAYEANYPVAVIGKVADVFNHRGITLHQPGSGNEDVAESLNYLLKTVTGGVIWATFGDFDTLYGHRNDGAGFADALESFDERLEGILRQLKHNDILMITADHGCDPTHPGTDHTREYVPIMAWTPSLKGSFNLLVRSTLADLGATGARWLQLSSPERGSPFL